MTATDQQSELLQAVEATVQKILFTIEKAKNEGRELKEAMVETIVIEPLLSVLGYDVWEYQKQGRAEAVGNYPDYTLLPDDPDHKWFIEVKRWDYPLTEKEASQTVRYASDQGTQWAILTNGNEWRIYDAYSKAPLPDKCVVVIHSLLSPNAAKVLTLLSKDAMLRKQLNAYCRTGLIHRSVQAELLNQESDTLAALQRAIRQVAPDVTKSEIVGTIQSLFNPSKETVSKPMLTPIKDENDRIPSHEMKDELSINDVFQSIVGRQCMVSKEKPAYISFSDNTGKVVNNWSDFTFEALKWIFQKYGVPQIPFSSTNYKSDFLNFEQRHHMSGKPWNDRRTRELPGKDGRPIYIYLNYHAKDYVECIYNVIKSVGASPTEISMRLQSSK